MTPNGIVLVVSVSIIQEDILEAARREAKEETGYDVKLTATIGIYNFMSSTNQQVILFHFIGEIIGGSLQLDTAEIIDSKWIVTGDLLTPDFLELRDKEVIQRITKNLISQKEYSLSLFNSSLGEHGLN